MVRGGPSLGLSTSGVARAMRAGGYDYPARCLSGGIFYCNEYGPTPYSEYAGPSWELGVQRRLNATTWLEVLAVRDRLGRTIGYRNELPAGFMYLNQTVTAYAFVFGKGRETSEVSLRHPFISGGPALCRLELDHEGPPHVDVGDGAHALVPGAVASVGYAFRPAGGRFSAQLQLRFSLIPPVQLGPVLRPFSGGDPAGSLPRTRMSFTHVTAGIGLGFRL
jgi:hypothetical protein